MKLPEAMDFFQDPPRLGNQYDGGPPAPELAGAHAARAGAPGDRARAARDGRARGDHAARALDAGPPRRAAARALRPVGTPGRRDPRARGLARLRPGGGGVGAGRDPPPAGARRLLPHPPGRAGPPLRALELHLHLPAGDDRRRGDHAARPRERGPGRARGAAADQPRSGAGLDQRAVDDRADRRLRRRAEPDPGGARRRRLAAPRHQVVHLGDHQRDDAHPGPPRGQPGRREGPGALLPGAPRGRTGRPTASGCTGSRTSSAPGCCPPPR